MAIKTEVIYIEKGMDGVIPREAKATCPKCKTKFTSWCGWAKDKNDSQNYCSEPCASDSLNYNSAAHELREIHAHYKEQNAPSHQLTILHEAIQHFEKLSKQQSEQQEG